VGQTPTNLSMLHVSGIGRILATLGKNMMFYSDDNDAYHMSKQERISIVVMPSSP
jgi:hypothetical protein